MILQEPSAAPIRHLMSMVAVPGDGLQAVHYHCEALFQLFSGWMTRIRERHQLSLLNWQNALRADWGIKTIQVRDNAGNQSRRYVISKAIVLECVRRYLKLPELQFDQLGDLIPNQE